MTASRTLIRNGRVVDPGNKVDGKLDVLIEDGKIAKVGAKLDAAGAVVVDAAGKVVCPGLIDVHVHFREPGTEAAETIASGAAAAVAGGFSTVCCMPNTKPALDNQAQLEFVMLQSERAGMANVFPVCAVTKERKGEELTEMGLNVEAGAVAFSDDGSNINRADVMKKALEYAQMFDKVIMVHAEDCHLSGGVMNASFTSTKMGLPGIPTAAEDVIVARDIILCKMTGGRLHIAHVASGATVDLIRKAKAEGLPVTGETAPHYFTFCDEDIEAYGPMLKMMPPIRGAKDRDMILEGLRDGTLDVIASDHAPHTSESKALGMYRAPFGIIGLETMLPMSYTRLVKTGLMPLDAMLATLTCNPARLLRLDGKGHLGPGADADVAILDLDTEWTIDKEQFKSKSRNCPFHGMNVYGRATDVFVHGKHFQN